MKYLKLFDSISSDRRAFKNWLTQIGENDEFDEELFVRRYGESRCIN